MTDRSADLRDEGGESPCWAHLVDGADDGDAAVPGALGAAGWASLVDQLADAVLVADREGTITYWNRAAERLFGWSAGEAIGANLDLIIPERLRRRHWDGFARAVATGEVRGDRRVLEVPALHREGRPLSIAFTLTVLADPADGRVSRLAAVVRDDTERWQERRRLRAELAELRDGQPAAEVSE